MLDVADGGRHRAVDHGRDAVLHLCCGQPAVAPNHADDRDVDARENVRRHRDDRQQAEHRDEQRDDDERVRPAKGESDDPHRRPCVLRQRRGHKPRVVNRRTNRSTPIARCASRHTFAHQPRTLNGNSYHPIADRRRATDAIRVDGHPAGRGLFRRCDQPVQPALSSLLLLRT